MENLLTESVLLKSLLPESVLMKNLLTESVLMNFLSEAVPVRGHNICFFFKDTYEKDRNLRLIIKNYLYLEVWFFLSVLRNYQLVEFMPSDLIKCPQVLFEANTLNRK